MPPSTDEPSCAQYVVSCDAAARAPAGNDAGRPLSSAEHAVLSHG